MNKNLLTFVITLNDYNDNNSKCFKSYEGYDKKHINALFKLYNYFIKNYYLFLIIRQKKQKMVFAKKFKNIIIKVFENLVSFQNLENYNFNERKII